jgi:two-component system, OmpR family, phosphate regulon sensor histidine kinase PhoR
MMGKQRVMGGVPRARSELGRSRGDRSPDDRSRPSAGHPHLDERRAQFIAVVSHELRTPLTSIVSFSELLRGEADGLTADGIRFLEIIERNADRLFSLIDDLLMLNRLEAGGLPLEVSEVSISGLAAEAVRNAQPLAAKVGVTIHLDAGEGPSTSADPRRLLQILDNLIGNAVKFSNSGGLVLVVTRCTRSAWRIDVSDTGIGIPPDEAAKLFGAFVRGSNARIAGLPGTGLGLSIVKALVEMHGGDVRVESVLNEGTKFSVFLPVTSSAGAR